MTYDLKIIGKCRLLIIHGVIVFFTVCSLYVIAFDKEYWPFSPYPMYAGLYKGDYKQIQLFGVTKNGEIVLMPTGRYLTPFGSARLQRALKRLHRRTNNLDLIDKALRYCFDQYETNRRAGIHDSLPLQGIRFYELRWKPTPWAQNADRPDSKKLIYEFIPYDS